MEAGFHNLKEVRQQRIRCLRKIIAEYLVGYRLRYRSASFAECALGHVSRLLGGKPLVDVSEAMVLGCQESRLREKASPKSINEEVRFLLKMLSNIARDVAQDSYNRRIYLPASYLHATDLEHALLLHEPAARKRLMMATSRLLALSEFHYERAFDGIHTLPWRVRWSILAAALCYREIGIQAGRNVPASWCRRTQVSSARKLWLIALAGLGLFQPRFWKRRGAVFATNLPVIS